jgi:hypothetical protein
MVFIEDLKVKAGVLVAPAFFKMISGIPDPLEHRLQTPFDLPSRQ